MQGGTLGRIPFIGWGKPTPVNPLRWRDKNKANVMVSLAGIFANLITAIAVLIAIKICQYTGLFNAAINPVEEPLRLLLINGLLVNTSLALFNLLPFPPLDGSKVVETFLPDGLRPVFAIFEQYGFLILWMLMYMGFFNAIFSPVSSLLVFLLRL
jgi:Zn-dependent protease